MTDSKIFRPEEFDDIEEMFEAASEAGLTPSEAIELEIAFHTRRLKEFDIEMAEHAEEMKKLNALKKELYGASDDA